MTTEQMRAEFEVAMAVFILPIYLAGAHSRAELSDSIEQRRAS